MTGRRARHAPARGRRILAAILLLALVGCGSASEDSSAPVVRVISPSEGRYLASPSLRVEGTARDASRIVRLTVNGVAAHPTAPGYAHWEVYLQLPEGESRLRLRAEDELGNAAETSGIELFVLADYAGRVNAGHGGAKDLCPANTLSCYRTALEAGANAVEADLQVLGDGSLVMFHDGNTAPQTGEDRDLEGLTLAEMEALDAGWGFSPDGGFTHPYRGQGIHVPTFAAFLDAFRGVPVLLDVKVQTEAMAQALFAFVEESFDEDARAFVHIKTHDQALTDRLRALKPPPRVAFNTWERAVLVVLPDRLAHLPPTWIDMAPEYLFPHVAEWAERHGHIFTTSTIDEVEAMEELLSIEHLDGIVTNRPDLLRELLLDG